MCNNATRTLISYSYHMSTLIIIYWLLQVLY
jgi:hypothetical protein